MTTSTCTVPINLNGETTIRCTPEWWLDKGEYKVLECAFEFLICGEATYGALYRAIERAKKSVSLICWGFQPSMYLVRNGDNQSLKVGKVNSVSSNLTIGQLLEKKAHEGVKVRVLCWADRLQVKIPTGLIGQSIPVNTNLNLTPISGEANTPGLGLGLGKNRNFGKTDEQHDYDEDFFECYVRNLNFAYGNVTNWLKRTTGWGNAKLAENLEFRLRGFTEEERAKISFGEHDDPVGPLGHFLYFVAPTHHQKMALIDYEDPQNHVGFVMGHNMLDEYWDTPAHSYYRKEPHTGRNGSLPRQDLSSRVTGQIVGDLFKNFSQAWERAGGGKMPDANFALYRPHLPEGGNLDQQKCMAQLVRTQPQYGVQDIKKMYLQNVENATEYIYFENQYFRWPTFADAILKHVERMTAAGRDPSKHGNLHLFVITNSSDEGLGPGALNTVKMLEKLGSANVMPEAARQNRVNDLDTKIKQAETDLKAAKKTLAGYEGQLNSYRKNIYPEAYKEAQDKVAAQQQEIAELKEEREKLKKGDTIVPKDKTGLKIHVCTIVPPDTPAHSMAQLYAKEIDEKIRNIKGRIDGLASQIAIGTATRADIEQLEELKKQRKELQRQRDTADTWKKAEEGIVAKDHLRWPETYIHSKLMIIDDTFITLGSANINMRSMEVDSELNILHTNHHIATQARRDLWRVHTGGMGVQDAPDMAYDAWGKIIEDNASLEEGGGSPIAPLRGFMRMNPSLRNWD